MKAVLGLLTLIILLGCSVVPVYDRAYLSDPIMQGGQRGFSKQTLEDKFFSTQEGSIGGESGVAGGCGCAK